MRLQLVIEGDGSGARKAIEETARGVEDLGRKSEEAGKRAEAGARGFEWLSEEEERARLGLKEAGAAGTEAAGGLDKAGSAAGRAAGDLGSLVEQASAAGPKLTDLRALLMGGLGGLAAGVAISAVGEGLKLAAGAAGELVREIVSSQPQIERALESHAELVGRIRGAYAEAAGAASQYGLNAASILRFESQQNVGRLEGVVDTGQRELYRSSDALRPSDVLGNPFGSFGPLADEVEAYRRALKEGEADTLAFREAIGAIAETLPEDSPFRDVAEAILEDTRALAENQAELERARDLLAGLKGDAEAAAAALGGKAEKYGELGASAGEAAGAIGASAGSIRDAGAAAESSLPALREMEAVLKSIAAGGVPQLGSPARAALTPLTAGRGFASGGYTGDDDPRAPVGVVHGREFVVNARATASHRPLLEAINAGLPGYAAGGYVNPSLPMAGGAAGGIVGDLARDFQHLQGTLHQFGTVLMRTGSASQALESVFNAVTQKLIDQALRALDQFVFGGGSGGGSLLGSLLGGFGGGFSPGAMLSPAAWGVVSSGLMTGLFHGGGTVGQVPAAQRLVPDHVFAGAPRLHGGGWLKPGERPVIAKDGEEIGWPDQLAAKYGRATGRSVVEVRLAADLEARLLRQAAETSVEIVRDHEDARRNQYENGGRA